MQEFFAQEISYQQPYRDRLVTTLLNMIYLEIKKEVDCLLEANNMINIVSDKSNVITSPLERKSLKRKSRDNYHPELRFSQFDFHYNASSSLTSIAALGPSSYTLGSPSSTPLGWQGVYVQARKIFRLGIYLQIVHLSRYGVPSSSVTQ